MDLVAMQRFFRVGGGPSTPAGYLLAAVVCALLAVLFWIGGSTAGAAVSGVVAVLALLVAAIGRGVQVGQRANRHE